MLERLRWRDTFRRIPLEAAQQQVDKVGVITAPKCLGEVARTGRPSVLPARRSTAGQMDVPVGAGRQRAVAWVAAGTDEVPGPLAGVE